MDWLPRDPINRGWRKRLGELPKMEGLVEGQMECGFFISLSKFRIRAYLEGLRATPRDSVKAPG